MAQPRTKNLSKSTCLALVHSKLASEALLSSYPIHVAPGLAAFAEHSACAGRKRALRAILAGIPAFAWLVVASRTLVARVGPSAAHVLACITLFAHCFTLDAGVSAHQAVVALRFPYNTSSCYQ